MPKFTKKNNPGIIGILEAIAPLIIDGAKWAYTRMRHAEEVKKLKPKAPVAPVSTPKTTKKVEPV